MRIPDQLRTPRLLLRRWRTTDAAELQPVLEANFAHLGPWIPARVAEPVPLPRLVDRLSEFSRAFDAGREWRYGLFAIDLPRLVGEVSLFPRDASGRVPFDKADHIEIGYWLRSDATGRGFATEAVRAALDLAAALPRISRVSIWCDERNRASAALPRRLGFHLSDTIVERAPADDAAAVRLQVWEQSLPKETLGCSI